MTWLTALAAKAIAAAATITGKKFALMVASSLVATTGILAAALTDGGEDLGPLAALLGRPVAASTVPAAEPEAEFDEAAAEAAGGSSPEPASGGEGSSSGSLPAPEPEPEAEPEEEPEEKKTTPTEPELPPGQVQHVFVIALASPGYEAAFGATPQMPYLANTLRPAGSLLTNFKLLTAAAVPNVIATVSGQRPNPATEANCPTFSDFPPGTKNNSAGFVFGEGCYYPTETLSLGDQVSSARLAWRAYMEAMIDPTTGKPDSCVLPEAGAAEVSIPGGYSSNLNPFVHFRSLVDLGSCTLSDVPLTELEKDLKKVETTPNWSWISPTPCNAGMVGACPEGVPQGPVAADAFLAKWVPIIQRSAAFKKDGVLIITFNQASPPDPTLPPVPNADPLKVGTLVLSRFASPGGIDATPYDPYSLLRTSEDFFRLNYLAGANGSKVKSFAGPLMGENGGD